MSKVAEIVTENIIKMLDSGTVPWRRPWRVNGGDVAINSWGKPYRGINVFMLAVSKISQGFQSNIWMTYKQIEAQGGRVLEGQKGTLVVFWKVGQEIIDPETGKKKRPAILRYFTVFNLEQTHDVKLTGVQQKHQDKLTATFTPAGPLDVNEDAEAIISTYLASDNAPAFNDDGSPSASYSQLFDRIDVPARTQYDALGDYYTTTFHEFGHSTGHKSRLGRSGIDTFDHFGSEQYAAEELVAELTAAFLSADSGVDNTLEQSAAYIAGWRQKLSNDPNLIISAAGKAQKAYDYILGVKYNNESE